MKNGQIPEEKRPEIDIFRIDETNFPFKLPEGIYCLDQAIGQIDCSVLHKLYYGLSCCVLWTSLSGEKMAIIGTRRCGLIFMSIDNGVQVFIPNFYLNKEMNNQKMIHLWPCGIVNIILVENDELSFLILEADNGCFFHLIIEEKKIFVGICLEILLKRVSRKKKFRCPKILILISLHYWISKKSR